MLKNGVSAALPNHFFHFSERPEIQNKRYLATIMMYYFRNTNIKIQELHKAGIAVPALCNQSPIYPSASTLPAHNTSDDDSFLTPPVRRCPE